MVRDDTKTLLARLFQQETTSPADPWSLKTDEVNVETMLIIESWVKNKARVQRIVPFDNEDKASLKDFETPWLGSGEFVDLLQNPACQVWDRLWKATEVVREAHHRYGGQGVSVCSLQGAPTTSRLGHCDSRLSTLHLSSENSILAKSYTRENKRAAKAHWVSMAWQAKQEDHIYGEAKRLGLAEVTQEVTAWL